MFETTREIVEEANFAVEQELNPKLPACKTSPASTPPSTNRNPSLQPQASLEEALAETRFRLDSLHLVVVRID